MKKIPVNMNLFKIYQVTFYVFLSEIVIQTSNLNRFTKNASLGLFIFGILIP